VGEDTTRRELAMDTTTMIYVSATLSFLFLCVGIIVGWNGKQFVHDYMWSRDEAAYHPEMYDENGIMLNEELLTVKFINEDDLDETFDE
tara:strand:- start:1823 stop:2089 length:267 start_codon:yes stop_codon:yes gene_type:complete